MKRITPYIYIYIVMALGAFMSCTSEDVPYGMPDWTPSKTARYLRMEQTDMSLAAAEGSTVRTYVEAVTTPWQFSGQAAWLTVAPHSGTADAEVSMTATANPSGNAVRTSVFRLHSAVEDYAYEVPVTVTQQAAEPFLTVSETDLTVGVAGGTKTVEVTTNIAYTLSVTPASPWLTIAMSEDKSLLTLTVAPNATAASRTAHVTLGGIRSVAFSVTQEAAGMTATEYGPLSVGQQGASYALKITSDAAWTASTGGRSWFALTPASGEAGTTEVVLSVAPNHTTGSRTGTASFRIGDTDMIQIGISQAGMYCSVSPSSLSLGANADSRTLEVTSNTEWAVLSKPSWITVSAASGEGDATLTVSATEHTGQEVRTGELIIGRQGVTGMQAKVQIAQSQYYFHITPSALATLPSTGGTHEVSIASDDAWSATKRAPWLTLSSASGRGNIEVTMTVADNPSLNERCDTVVFRPAHAPELSVVTRQAARYLTVDNTRVSFYWAGGTSQPVVVTTDGTFTVTADSEWLTVERSDRSFTLTATEHDQAEPRDAVVTVTLTGLVAGESYHIDIPVVQLGNKHIDIETFPDDKDWDLVGGSQTTVSISRFPVEDASWDGVGGTAFQVEVNGFDADDNWNP